MLDGGGHSCTQDPVRVNMPTRKDGHFFVSFFCPLDMVWVVVALGEVPKCMGDGTRVEYIQSMDIHGSQWISMESLRPI